MVLERIRWISWSVYAAVLSHPILHCQRKQGGLVEAFGHPTWIRRTPKYGFHWVQEADSQNILSWKAPARIIVVQLLALHRTIRKSHTMCRSSVRPFPQVLSLVTTQKRSVPAPLLPENLQLSLILSRLNRPTTLCCSSYSFPSRSFLIFVALLWTLSTSFISFLH